MDDDYSVSPQAYLARVKEQLEQGTPQSLFYAAFELRCFVESRQSLYLEAQGEYARSIPKAHKIGAQGKALEAIFESNRIQHITWSAQQKVIFDAYYVPLHPDLRKYAERLGDLLHARNAWIAPDNEWWHDTYSGLCDAYELAWQCCQGSLLSPMFLIDGKTIGRVSLSVSGSNHRELLAALKEGEEGILGVDYLDRVPESWKSDLEPVTAFQNAGH
ncbi:hypothetical protein [Rhodophyticola sp.]|jgi:hypothetical protein|uniref:hypothetical protein n=1 Tax=Rhodophyticola sp. TaxID=2680032 RepID=UPI003D2A80D2